MTTLPEQDSIPVRLTSPLSQPFPHSLSLISLIPNPSPIRYRSWEKGAIKNLFSYLPSPIPRDGRGAGGEGLSGGAGGEGLSGGAGGEGRQVGMKAKNNMNIAKTQLAQEFRKLPTKSEKIFWEKLRRNNLDNLYFRRQYVIDGYIVDFYCSKLKLAIEIDGGIHQNKTKKDAERQKIIEKRGIIFFRTSSEEVENNIDEVIKKLRKHVKQFLSPAQALAR